MEVIDLYNWIVANWQNKTNYRESTSDPSDSPSQNFIIHNNTTTKTIYTWNGTVWSQGLGGGSNSIKLINSNTEISGNTLYFCNVINNAITLTFPSTVTFSTGSWFEIMIVAGDTSINNVIINFGTIPLQNETSSTFTMNVNGYFRFTYIDETIGFTVSPIDMNGSSISYKTFPVLQGVVNTPSTKSTLFTTAGYYSCKVAPSDGLPTGINLGDVFHFDGTSTYTLFTTYDNCPAVVRVGTGVNGKSYIKNKKYWGTSTGATNNVCYSFTAEIPIL